MNKHLQNKKRIMLLFVAFFMGIGASWAYDYDFSAIAPSGQTLYYDIISSTDHTVGLVSPNEAYQEVPYVIGDLIIPSEVSYDGEIYTVTALLNNHNEGALQMTGLTSVVIPETVNNVQAAAFYQSTALTTIICLATTPPSSSGGGYEEDTWASFYGLSENCVLYVPEGSFESYQADDYWGSRLPVQAIDGQPHEIIAIAMPTEGGMVSGEGTYEWNSACTLTATPNEGYIFLYWTEDGVRVSNDAEYSFNVTSDRNLEAHFVEEGSMCNLVVQLFDSYGDGWNGNKLVVSHGDESSEEITLSGGSSGEQTITVINGDHITLTWINGQYIGECSFNICYSNGNVIYHGENMSSNFSYEFDVDCEEIPGTTGNDGTLTVYDGTVQNEGMPIIGWGACYLFKCEYVMPASDLAPMKESLITSMTCYNTDSNVSYGSASFKVFMKEVDFENFDDSDVFQGYEDGTVVYEGSLFLSSQGLLEIEFTTPYYYQGGNLLIGVYNCVKGNRVGWSYFYGQTLSHETGFVSTLNEGDDINLLTGPGFRETFMPKTTFTFTELNGAYNITSMSSPIEGGTVTGAGEYALGETCTLMATPNEGYTFVNWTEDGEEVSTDAEYSFTVTYDRNLIANFMSDVVNHDEGSLTVCDGTVTNECFPVTGWCINQYGKQEYVMPASMLTEMNGSCITSMKCYSSNYSSVSYGSAYFQVFMKEVDSATVTEYQGMDDATIVYEGNLSVSNGELLINFTTPYCYHGGNLLIGVYNPVKTSFQIFNGRFYGITVQDSDICGWSPYSIDDIFGSNGQFWNFLPKTTFTYIGMEGVFNVTAIPAPAVGGTVSGAGAYAWDETCVLTATANEGYTFVSWTENGEEVSSEAEYSFTVISDRVLVANFINSAFQPDSFNINAAPNPSESGVVAGDGYYEFGSLVTLTATANEGYSFVSWIENGEEVSADATYTFTVTGERNLLANFTVAETSEVNHWTPNSSSFANNMTLTGVILIDGVEQASDRLELGAFCGEQCRGSQSASCFGPTQRYVVQITIFGEMGDQISFRLYDHETEQELDLVSPAPVNFNVDGYGNLLNPYVLNFISPFASSQTTPLTEGWNWWSSYIELSGINGLALVENSLGEHGLLIKSRENGYVESFENNGSLMWYGTLKSINNEQLYMIRTSAACEVSVTGEPANPENHPITLNLGWNWIGFPCQQPMSVGTAMSGITPEGDDIVKGRNGYASYYAGDGNWYGTLNTLEPGQGYMYQSLGDEAKTLVYATNRSEATRANIIPEYNVFKPYDGDHANNMTLTTVVELNGNELRQEGYELAAFVDEECRGSVKLQWVAPLNRYVAFLTVFGEQDEMMTFRLTDGTAIATAAEKQTFTVDATLGTLTSPVVLRFGNLGIDDSVMPQVSVYPNPSDGVFQVEGTGIERVEVYNTLGQRVFMEKAKADMMSVDLRAQAEGLYTLRVVTANGVSVHNIVKR